MVDADTHITEWPDLWTSRAPAKFKDRMPQRKTANGRTAWMIGDYELGKNYGFSAIMKDGSKLPGLEFFDHPLEDVTLGAYDLQARLAYLDDNGIAAQVAYTNLLGFGGGKSMKVEAELREMAIRIQNEAMAELQAESAGRVYPMAMLPWWDVEAAVAEAERCADMGLRGINIHANPQHHGLPDLGHEHWTPLWELCEDRRLPVNFHVGFSQGSEGWENPDVWPSLQGYEKYAVSGSMLFTGNMITVLNLLMSGIFKRHPQAAIHLGRERGRLGAVHAGDAAISGRGEHARLDRIGHRCVQRAFLDLLLVGEDGADRCGATCGCRIDHVRDRLAAPDLPLSRSARLSPELA